jgi:hypothetical protein
MTLTINDQRIFLTGPVRLAGYQAILKPSKFGYSLSAVVPDSYADLLDKDRVEALKWAQAKVTNPKRATLKPEPWEESPDNPGYLKVKFSWNEETKPYIFDTANEPVDDEGVPLYSDSIVKLAFKQRPYILKDGVTYGSTLKLVGIQVVSLSREGVGTDSGDLSFNEVTNMFTVDQSHGLDREEAKQAKKAAKATAVSESTDF